MPALPPLNSPAASYQAHKAEVDGAIAAVFRNGRFILGEQTAEFESEFAAFMGAAHAIGVGTGTDAIEIALRACDIGPGDGVLTVSHTAVATVAAIERAGATPLLVDIDAETCTMDPQALEATIREWKAQPNSGNVSLKAIVPVHLYGHPAAMAEILGIARQHGLRVIEDCAQSHGAKLNGQTTGTMGDLGAFSFYPTKNLGAFGDGGAVITNDAVLAEKVRVLREYGWAPRGISSVPGLNSRLDELQGAILRVLLRYLDAENKARQRLAGLYVQLLDGTALSLPTTGPGATHVFHQFVVRSGQRDTLKARLAEQGVATLIHYAAPVHLQPAYRDRLFFSPGGLPHTEAAARQVLSLPMSPHLSAAQVTAVSERLRTVLKTL